MSKQEKKRKEAEQLKLLKNILSSNTLLAPLLPLQKANEYLNMISKLERSVSFFPEKDKNEKYYKQYKYKIEELYEDVAKIFFSEKKYKECIEIDLKLLKYNDKNDKALIRLYKSYYNLGDKESAVIYGSFLYLRCDKKTQNKYKDLIKEIKDNFKEVALEYKNKSFLSEIKLTKKSFIRFILFIICVIYLIKNISILFK